MRDYATISKRLRQYSENCVAYKLDADFANAVTDAADAIEDLLRKMGAKDSAIEFGLKRIENLQAENEQLKDQVPTWISVEERLPERTNPFHARDVFLVRLRSGCIKTLFYEYDNSDRCRTGMSPLFKEGWAETATPVTHWMELPKFEPPKGGNHDN